MYFSRRRQHTQDIWPGFVDVIATVLMVLIFVLMTFVIAQLYLTDTLSNRDQDLAKLRGEMEHLRKEYTLMKEEHLGLKNKTLELTSTLDQAHKALSILDTEKSQLIEVNQKLEITNKTIAEDLLKLEEVTEHLKKKENERILEISKIKKALGKNKKGIGHYRSEFFAKLQKVLGHRSDIRVVGDRFIFQSEVLFDKASAELDKEGVKNLDQLVDALKEISEQIPQDINWVLRIDGHTDQLPIHTARFPSNWELSSARAISVVKYMISKGIEPQHLVAAGFGEYQPLQDMGEDAIKITKEKGEENHRRIEFKLDQR